MRRFSLVCLTAAAVAAPALHAASFDNVVEPAMVMKLDFGGARASDFTMGLRLNYATSIRQSLGAMSVSPETALDAMDLRLTSSFFSGPSLTQLDFKDTGFHKASLMGRTLVTRYVMRQDEEAPAEEGMEGEEAAEEGEWYDYEQWGWKGWTLAAVGAYGVYTLVDDDDDSSGGGGGGGGDGGGGGGGEICIEDPICIPTEPPILPGGLPVTP